MSKPGEGSGYLPTMNDIRLFGRRVSGGRTMGEGAEVACQAHIQEYNSCVATNGSTHAQCLTLEDAVLECKGSFLCPALAAQWVRCLAAKKKGYKDTCEQEKSALEGCMNANSTE
eukprot:CAMPEP_0184312606 /NCGR_PEP_ID=MMETSP1049-20130417/50705_1 /TAXON_ID=77928 /ORGANISM="Proteomonas sulcata, Strain CCMP704" /LENGTH=114 /DNA_ID=CAMNT_0026628867 /DNA_START=20 /DNA_END=364 /DNA_ORIENTATION=-